MAINFPDSPSLNDTHTVGDKTWVWDGTVWSVVVGAVPTTVSELTISNDLTVDTDTLHVDSTNDRVGIGTTTPSASLEVVGTSVFDSVYSESTSNWNFSQLRATRNASNTANTKIASFLLDGDTASSTNLYDSVNFVLRTDSAPTTGSTSSGLNAGLEITAPDSVRFGTGSAERVRIDSSGNVGIGTTTPRTPLEIQGTSSGSVDEVLLLAADGNQVAGSGARLHLSGGNATQRSVYVEGVNTSGATNAHALTFGTSSGSSDPVERMRITSGGNVGINDATPSYTLDVNGDINATGDVRVAGNPVGLVLVKETTIGTSVSSVTVSDCFNSTFQNYRVVVNMLNASTALSIRVRVNNSTTNYFSAKSGLRYNGGTFTGLVNNDATYMDLGSAGSSAGGSMTFDVIRPYVTQKTLFTGTGCYALTNTGGTIWFSGFHNSTLSVTSLTFLTSTGTLTSGTIRVYGYNDG